MFICVSYSIVYLISQSFDVKAAGYKWDEGDVLKVLVRVGLPSNLRDLHVEICKGFRLDPPPKKKI